MWTNLGHHGNPFSNRHCLYLSTHIPLQLARVISFYQASLPCLSPLPATVTLSAILAGIHPNTEFSHRLFICLFIYFFRQGLAMYSVLASRAQSSCLTFPSTGIIGMCHLAWSPTLFRDALTAQRSITWPKLPEAQGKAGKEKSCLGLQIQAGS